MRKCVFCLLLLLTRSDLRPFRCPTFVVPACYVRAQYYETIVSVLRGRFGEGALAWSGAQAAEPTARAADVEALESVVLALCLRAQSFERRSVRAPCAWVLQPFAILHAAYY